MEKTKNIEWSLSKAWAGRLARKPRLAMLLIFAGLFSSLLAAAQLILGYSPQGGPAIEQIALAIFFCCLAAWLVSDRLLARLGRRADELAEVLSTMAGGKLNVTAVVEDGEGPLGDLASSINELSSDIQEVLLTLWKQNVRSQGLLNSAEEKLTKAADYVPVNEALESLAILKGCLSQNQDLIGAFTYFDVRVGKDAALLADEQDDSA